MHSAILLVFLAAACNLVPWLCCGVGTAAADASVAATTVPDPHPHQLTAGDHGPARVRHGDSGSRPSAASTSRPKFSRRDLNERLSAAGGHNSHNHQHHHHQQQRSSSSGGNSPTYPNATRALYPFAGDLGINGTCESCHKMHDDIKVASLEYIKNYVLTWLGFGDSGPPTNSGNWPSVPANILDDFYAQTGRSKNHDWERERISNYNQQKYLDHYPGAGLFDGLAASSMGGGGTIDQDFLADDPRWNKTRAPGSRTAPPSDEDYDYYAKMEHNSAVTHRIYIFPNVTKLRHQSHEILNFEFPAAMLKKKKSQGTRSEFQTLSPTMHLDVTKAELHLSFCNRVNLSLVEELRHNLTHHKKFSITAHRLVVKDSAHRNATAERFSKEEVTLDLSTDFIVALLDDKYAELASTEAQKPNDSPCRRSIKIDLTALIKDWYKSPKKNHGLFLTTEPVWLKHFISLQNTKEVPFFEMWTVNTKKKRFKRFSTLTCTESEYEPRCCLYPLVVDFDKFGWDWIIAPKKYEANYCAGECRINFLPRYTHTHVMQLTKSAQACCSPRKMQPLNLLYFNRQEMVIHTTLTHMIVESCSCS